MFTRRDAEYWRQRGVAFAKMMIREGNIWHLHYDWTYVVSRFGSPAVKGPNKRIRKYWIIGIMQEMRRSGHVPRFLRVPPDPPGNHYPIEDRIR